MQTMLKWTGVFALLTALVVTSGCAATRGRSSVPEQSGFLGDYSQLRENKDYPAALVYVNPSAQWSRYNAIELDSVTLWASQADGDKMSGQEKQMLADTLFTELHEELDKYFVLARSPGPSTLRLRVALTQAAGANVPLRAVTTVVPQARLIGTVIGLGVDTAATVGSATVEMEVLDAITDRRLAAAVDQRAGTKVLLAKRAYTTWGDVEVACERWAKRVAWQFARAGVQRKPGAPMPEEPGEGRSL